MSIKQAIEALPPLPVCTHCVPYPGPEDILFTAEQMREYALAALRSMPQGEPYGQVTVVKRPGCQDQHWFYRWPDPPYLDNAAECVTVYATKHTEAVRMSEDELWKLWNAQGSDFMDQKEATVFARAVEQATAARLGVKMGDV